MRVTNGGLCVNWGDPDDNVFEVQDLPAKVDVNLAISTPTHAGSGKS